MAILQFSDTTTKKGIVQQIQKRTKTATANANAYSVNEICVDVNLALAEYFIMANKYANNKWTPADDTNQIDYPIIYGDVNLGQQDITLLTDATGNQILDVYKVRIKDPVTLQFRTIELVDVEDVDDNFMDTTQTGVPTKCLLTANGLFFDVLPNYTLAGGVELFINRTASYFVPADTTKAAGIPDEHQLWLVYKPSYEFCAINGLPQTAMLRELLYGIDGKGGIKADIKEMYATRNRSVRKALTARQQNNK